VPVALPAGKPRGLLQLLLLEMGAVVSVERLIDSLWDTSPPATAWKAVQRYVLQLRRALGASVVLTRSPGYLVPRDAGELDLHRFEALLARAQAAPPEEASTLLVDALARWRGPPLAELRDSLAVQPELARLEALRLAGIEERVEAELALGRHDALLPELERLVARQPLRERLCAQLMLALYRSGRQAEALASYQKTRSLLVEELGLEPSHELQELNRAILNHDASLRFETSRPEQAPESYARRERKVVTVLFADLAAFTSQAEGLDPEDVVALLDAYHAQLKAELERYGGTAEKFIGNAVMAVFGAPAAHEDDPERAVRAALAIREWAGETGVELRVGIATGEALVTLDAEGQGTAAGDVVKTAARLQSAAPVGGILVGEATMRSTARAIEYGVELQIDAKSKAHPVPAWPVIGARSRPHVERVHGATLVGREHELTLLSGAFERSRREASMELVTLIGIPGIGKSRLVHELYMSVERDVELTSWRHGHCLAYGDGITFWALGEMVKAEAGILEGDGPDEVERKLAAVSDDPWVSAHLRPLVGLAGADAAAGEDRREEAFTAWRRFFESLADRGALVLVFEDLHWADDSLLDFVDHLVDWASAVPLLVVCTARPELLSRRPGWGGGKPNALTISVSPLSDDDTARLVGELLETSVLEAETQAELLSRAGGNPLYAEEFARMLREHGELDRLPETVQGLIAARLDLLDTQAKTLLLDAAVIGKSFWVGSLAALGGAETSGLERGLHGLERREFVRRERVSSVADDQEYSFRHVLVRDVAYGQIPRAARVDKHLRAAGWIEALGRPDDHAETLAYHYLQALELAAAAGADVSAFAARAQSALAEAGGRAAALHAHAAAGRYYEAALELLPGGDPRRNRLLLKLGHGRWLIGEESLELLQEALDGFRAAGDAEGVGETETRLAESAWLRGERDHALEHLKAALEALDAAPPSRVKASAIAMASRFRMLAADPGDALEIGRRALAMAEELGLEETRAPALNNIGSARAMLGDVGGLDDLREAIEVAAAAGAAFELARATGNLAVQLWMSADVDGAIRLWEEAGEDSQSFGQQEFARWVVGVLIVPRFVAGQWDESLALAETLIGQVEGGRPHYLACQAYSCRAMIRLARGAAEAARADIASALETAARAGDPQAVVPTLARAAYVLAELGDSGAAAAAADDALPLVIEHVAFVCTGTPELAWALAKLGGGQRLVEALEGDPLPWSRAAAAFSRGEPLVAAEIAAGIGALTHEAYARLQASHLLLDQGRRTEAGEQLNRALAFFRSVGATRFEAEAQAAESARRRISRRSSGSGRAGRSPGTARDRP
jgi:class 3 adenylate cyclase